MLLISQSLSKSAGKNIARVFHGNTEATSSLDKKARARIEISEAEYKIIDNKAVSENSAAMPAAKSKRCGVFIIAHASRRATIKISWRQTIF